MNKIHQVDPTTKSHSETDVDRVLRGELYAASMRIEGIHNEVAQTGAWPWAAGQQTIASLERCLALGVTATARTLELAAPDWTVARRTIAMTLNVLIVMTRLRASDVSRRAAGHAMLAIGGCGLREPLTLEAAAKRALAILSTVPEGERLGPSPHRLHTTALVAATAGQSGTAMPLTRLLHAAFAMESKRIEPSGQRLSRIDLQAWLSNAIGREVDDLFGRAILGSLGPLPPGAHVMCEGRLGVVVGPGKAPDRPIVLLGGQLTAPDAPVAPSSPLGMSPWAQ